MRLGTIACNTQHLAVYLRYVGLLFSRLQTWGNEKQKLNVVLSLKKTSLLNKNPNSEAVLLWSISTKDAISDGSKYDNFKHIKSHELSRLRKYDSKGTF